jgi:competence protein ComEA
MKKLIIVLAVVLFALPTFTFASSSATTDTDTVASAPVNVNLATVKQLTNLPGVGKVTAERIVVFREANGPFATLDDLLKVNGLGKKTLAKIRDQISVN